MRLPFILLTWGCGRAYGSRRKVIQEKIAQQNSQIDRICEVWLSKSRNPRRQCAIGIKDIASSPWLLGPKVKKTINPSLKDVYALSDLQQQAFAIYNKCNNMESWKRHKWTVQTELLTNTPNEKFVEFLIEENEWRRRWVDRLIRLVWLNYEHIGLGSPEIDPDRGQPVDEWVGDPMFTLDNLDILAMFGLSSSLNKVLRWLEVDLFMREALSGHTMYKGFRDAFNPATETPLAKCNSEDVTMVSKKWVSASTPEENNEATANLSKLISDCLPNIFNSDHGTELMQRNAGQEDDQNILAFLRSKWGDLRSLGESHVTSFFEMTIRGLGGLIAAYHLTGHPVLLYSGLNLGHQLSYAFLGCYGDSRFHQDVPCLPPRDIDMSSMSNLMSDLLRKASSGPLLKNWNEKIKGGGISAAVLATNQLEFQALSQLTGLCFYSDISDFALKTAMKSMGVVDSGLFPLNIHQNDIGRFSGSSYYSMGAEGDSAYEYIVKGVFQLHERDEERNNFTNHFAQTASTFTHEEKQIGNSTRFKALLYGKAYPPHNQHWIDQGSMRMGFDDEPMIIIDDFSLDSSSQYQTRMSKHPNFHHLACFMGGMMAMISRVPFLNDDVKNRSVALAEGLADSCAVQYLLYEQGIAPEKGSYSGESASAAIATGFVRPEILESVKWTWDVTKKIKFRNFAWHAVSAILANARVRKGVCSLNNVEARIPSKSPCRQDTWILAETLKYIRLTFSSEKELRAAVTPLRNLQELMETGRRAVTKIVKGEVDGIPIVGGKYTVGQLGASNLASTHWEAESSKFQRGEYFAQRRDRDGSLFGSAREVLDWQNESYESDLLRGVVFSTEAHPLPLVDENTTCIKLALEGTLQTV